MTALMIFGIFFVLSFIYIYFLENEYFLTAIFGAVLLALLLMVIVVCIIALWPVLNTKLF